MEAVTEMETNTMMKQRVRPPVEVSNEQVCATWLCNFFWLIIFYCMVDIFISLGLFGKYQTPSTLLL